MLTIAVLGPVEVRRDGDAPAARWQDHRSAGPARARRRRAGAGRPDDRGPLGRYRRHGRNTLQSKVSQLRRALGEPGPGRRRPRRLHLDVDPERVDALHGSSALAAAAAGTATRSATPRRPWTGGARRWRCSAARCSSTPVTGLAAAHRARLEEIRLGLLEDHLAARVDLGAGGDVIGELEGLVDRTRCAKGCGRLITALYRAGRQADALAAYGRVRSVLVDELGCRPGPDLRALEAQILQQSPALAHRRPRAGTAGVDRGNLPD